MSDDGYKKYRGKCKEYAEQMIQENPEWELVRGYYHCPLLGRQSHWWCKNPDGEIVDPTAEQFPTNGVGAEYEEFDGMVECAQCSKQVPEAEVSFESNYAYCSTACHMRFVGLEEYV